MIDESLLRTEALAHLAVRKAAGVEWFTREETFSLGELTIRYMSPQTGIWKPAGWEGALSISTVYSLPGRSRPYDDELFGSDGPAIYKWRGTDPMQSDNRALRHCMNNQLPMIWFEGYAPGHYSASFPIYLIKEEPDQHQFVVALENENHWSSLDLSQPDSDIEVEYALRQTKQRLHQSRFRAAVMDAYSCRCAVCRFGHSQLLDAAHIIPDSQSGLASVTNGMALCRIHHAAYDNNIIGIRPDLVIEVNQNVLDEKDGPMLLHGIQEFNDHRLMVIPGRRALRPNPDFLQRRYEEFLDKSTFIG